ncbi:hypothetical protein HPP92_024812 [Vanilla planifolia]|uniref:Uncharacterized protein n=1 Tax=Vanilla planifolia TaxID=51239 RepID=A0A835PN70_VANPL|nr:hypothetical protein HPP92_024812 [Vanilla planifolia]
MVDEGSLWSSNVAATAKCSIQDTEDQIKKQFRGILSWAIKKRITSENPCIQMLQIEDGNRNQDQMNVQNSINFASRLQQFEQDLQTSEELRQAAASLEGSRPPSRSSVINPGQSAH